MQPLPFGTTASVWKLPLNGKDCDLLKSCSEFCSCGRVSTWLSPRSKPSSVCLASPLCFPLGKLEEHCRNRAKGSGCGGFAGKDLEQCWRKRLEEVRLKMTGPYQGSATLRQSLGRVRGEVQTRKSIQEKERNDPPPAWPGARNGTAQRERQSIYSLQEGRGGQQAERFLFTVAVKGGYFQ